ncbi:MAG: hypothetical protein ACRC2K_13375 [Clostridium sp.]
MEAVIILMTLTNCFCFTLGFIFCYLALKTEPDEKLRKLFKKEIAYEEKAFVPGDDEDDF